MNSMVPVIAIDGPTASGKGTVAQLVAARLGYHYLDSGALYRLVGLAATRCGVDLGDAAALAGLARELPVRFDGQQVTLSGEDVSDAIRSEAASRDASCVAAFPEVRAALLERQRAFRQPPGLVADGRDMGSVVFPDARAKFFLTADVASRAQRRVKQLKQKGMSVIMEDVVRDLQARDERDSTRPVAPLKRLPDAYLIDTTEISAEAAASKILAVVSRLA